MNRIVVKRASSWRKGETWVHLLSLRIYFHRVVVHPAVVPSPETDKASVGGDLSNPDNPEGV